MKTLLINFIVICFACFLFQFGANAQSGTITLSFSGDNNGQPETLENVWIKNLTQDCDTTIYGPDFSFSIDTFLTTFDEAFALQSKLAVSRNYPNPFRNETHFEVYLPASGELHIIVVNLLGEKVAEFSDQVKGGTNVFAFGAGKERVYLLTVKYGNYFQSLRLISTGSFESNVCSLKYVGNLATQRHKSSEFFNGFVYASGDQLLLVGSSISGQSGLQDSPAENTSYEFQFATNMPCIGLPTVDYMGQTYNTMQVFGQCWLKENLNAGEMINSSQPQTNNNIIEKYCMADMTMGCDMYGGMYYWDELMNYTSTTGGKGICPEGWHVPDDIDWRILEGATDSEFGIESEEWQNNSWRGVDAGGHLKETGTSNWEPPNTGATDSFGFCLLPGGYYVQNAFWGPGYKAYLWSSTYPQKYYRNIDWNQQQVNRNTGGGDAAFSIRCVKD